MGKTPSPQSQKAERWPCFLHLSHHHQRDPVQSQDRAAICGAHWRSLRNAAHIAQQKLPEPASARRSNASHQSDRKRFLPPFFPVITHLAMSNINSGNYQELKQNITADTTDTYDRRAGRFAEQSCRDHRRAACRRQSPRARCLPRSRRPGRIADDRRSALAPAVRPSAGGWTVRIVQHGPAFAQGNLAPPFQALVKQREIGYI